MSEFIEILYDTARTVHGMAGAVLRKTQVREVRKYFAFYTLYAISL